jgi:hypothetical protein
MAPAASADEALSIARRDSASSFTGAAWFFDVSYSG